MFSVIFLFHFQYGNLRRLPYYNPPFHCRYNADQMDGPPITISQKKAPVIRSAGALYFLADLLVSHYSV